MVPELWEEEDQVPESKKERPEKGVTAAGL